MLSFCTLHTTPETIERIAGVLGAVVCVVFGSLFARDIDDNNMHHSNLRWAYDLCVFSVHWPGPSCLSVFLSPSLSRVELLDKSRNPHWFAHLLFRAARDDNDLIGAGVQQHVSQTINPV